MSTKTKSPKAVKATKKSDKPLLRDSTQPTKKVRKVRSDKGTKVSANKGTNVLFPEATTATVGVDAITEDCKVIRELVFDLREVFQSVGVFIVDYAGLKQFMDNRSDGKANKTESLAAINAQAQSQGSEFVLLDLTSQNRGILAVHSDRPLALPNTIRVVYDPLTDCVKIERKYLSATYISLQFGQGCNELDAGEDW